MNWLQIGQKVLVRNGGVEPYIATVSSCYPTGAYVDWPSPTSVILGGVARAFVGYEDLIPIPPNVTEIQMEALKLIYPFK